MTGVYLTINNGQRETITTSSRSINVPLINSSNVKNGQSTSNVQRYDIKVEAYNAAGTADAREISVWNIPGMDVLRTNATVINTRIIDASMSQSEISTAITETGVTNIVLTNDIDLGNWTSVNLVNRNFYGNGNTITIRGLNTATNMGLFGTVTDGLIRDLTVAYANITVDNNASGAGNIGGLVGQATGNTQILNCIVRGINTDDKLNVNATSGGDRLIGGLAGFFSGSGVIENCRAELSVSYTSTGHTGQVRIGALAGETGTSTSAERTITTDIKATLNPGSGNVGPIVSLSGLLINSVTVSANVSADKNSRAGIIDIGGVIGVSGQNTINDVNFINGTVLFGRTSIANNNCGGLIGSSSATSIINCSFSGNIGMINNAEVGGSTRLGGLIGNYYITVDGKYYINNCTVRSNIDFKGFNNSTIRIGGVIGEQTLSANCSALVTNTFFEEGNITTRAVRGGSYGGFIGTFSSIIGYENERLMYNCGVRGGLMDITTSDDTSGIGGFAGTGSSHFSYCFSRINIITDSQGTFIRVGGFVGDLTSYSVSNCYATGTIRSVIRESTNTVYVGGLVGYTTTGSISDSYALGNVIVDRQSGSSILHVGGLVGRLNFAGTSVTNSFSAGQVIAQSEESNVFAGGLVGSRLGDISNSAALGASVTAKSPHVISVGRICGSTGNAGNNNYARDNMRIEVSNNPNALSFPFWDGSGTAPSTYYRYAGTVGTTTQHGENASFSTFFNPSFWTGTLGFSSTHWNFNRVGQEGFPRLRWE